MTRAVLEISKKKCKERYEGVRLSLPPETKVMAVVKANAYGLGAVQVARLLSEFGVNYFSVATLCEARELRRSDISEPILLLAEPLFDDIDATIDDDFCYTVYSLPFAEKLLSYARKVKKIIKVHIKINTGLNRLGCSKELFQKIYNKFENEEWLHIEGVYTHFSNASLPESNKTALQIKQFKEAISCIGGDVSNRVTCHLANSDGMTYFPESHSDMVRIGLRLYKDVVSLKGRILHICRIPKGASVSYNSEFVADKEMLVAIVSLGYADGVPTSLSNKGRVLINGSFCAILGRVCMDMICVELSEQNGQFSVGDDVVVLGQQGANHILLDEIVELTGDNPREITCRIGSRVKRSVVP